MCNVSSHNTQFKVMPKLNKKISLIQRDIINTKVDAIIITAQNTLLGGGGIDEVIHDTEVWKNMHHFWGLLLFSTRKRGGANTFLHKKNTRKPFTCASTRRWAIVSYRIDDQVKINWRIYQRYRLIDLI